MSEAELDSFKKMLRSVLLTSKDGFPIFKLEGEYRGLVGQDIPYKKFGFHSVQEFIVKKASDAAKLTRNNLGENVFVAIGTEETKHIERLVHLQKQSKKRKKFAVATRRNPMLGHRNPTYSAHRQPRYEISHTNHFRQNAAAPAGGGSSGFVVTRKLPTTTDKPSFGFTQNTRNDDVSKLTVNVGSSRSVNLSQKPEEKRLPSFSSGVARDITNNNNNRTEWKDLPPRFQKLNLKSGIDILACGDSNEPQRKSAFDRLGSRCFDEVLTVSPTFDSRNVVSTAKSLPEASNHPALYPHTRPASSSGTEDKAWNLNPPCFQVQESTGNEVKGTDELLLRQRLSQLLETYPSGVWLGSLNAVYETHFKTKAPSDLANMVEIWTDLILIEYVGFKKMVKLKIPAASQIRPTKLELTDEWQHDVYVSFVRNAGDVVVRILGDQHSSLLESLEEDYGCRALRPVDSIYKGLICLVTNDTDVEYEDCGKVVKQVEKCYNRVEVTSFLDHMATVEYLDHGGNEEVVKERLFSIPAASNLPSQAIHCVLEGLEDLKDNERLSALLLSDLPGLSCRAKGKRLNGKDLVFSLTLSGSDDDSFTINDQLRAEVCGPPTSKLTESFTTSVASVGYGGLVYLHALGPGLAKLNSLLKAMNWLLLKGLTSDDVMNHTDELRGLVLFTGGGWRRAKFLQVISETEVFVQDIDYGDVYAANISNLRVLSPETNQRLVNFPHQASRCIIKNLPENANEWTTDAYVHLSQKLLCKGTKVKAVVTDQNEKHINIVDLWLPPDKSVAGLMNAKDLDLWAKVKPCKVEPLSSGDDVYITDCQDPGNFKGFSKAYFSKVQQMMSEMQDFYKKYPMNELVPTFESLRQDGLYAVRLSDTDHWHRAVIVRIIKRNMISVHFVDFGHFYVIQSVSKFRYLPNSILQFPLVLHEMSLANVCHDGSKWSEQDTESLKQLIVGKTFRAFLSSKTPDLSQSISVTLINTCTCDNPFVHQILLQLNLVTPISCHRLF